ncbi:MAG: hypothetical protein BWZ02_02872 [Lentisphaerae bacterium ADurb.BinA184]|nr:MAG: hypothetical protein BWZ02_02872 [Lentisphaerae bacterium ADurb.BinA184]
MSHVMPVATAGSKACVLAVVSVNGMENSWTGVPVRAPETVGRSR